MCGRVRERIEERERRGVKREREAVGTVGRWSRLGEKKGKEEKKKR